VTRAATSRAGATMIEGPPVKLPYPSYQTCARLASSLRYLSRFPVHHPVPLLPTLSLTRLTEPWPMYVSVTKRVEGMVMRLRT
jgi:hypothetical protein